MASPLRPLSQIDFSGGENVVTSPFNLARNQVQQASNFILDEHGSLRVRDGTLIQGVQSPVPTRPIVKVYDLVQVDGTTTKLAIVNDFDGSGVNRLYDRDASPWTTLGTFSTSFAQPYIITFIDRAIIACGNTERLRTFSPSNFAVATPNAPSASHVAVHLGFVWCWNTNDTTTPTAGPSSLQASNVNDVSFPAASQTFISQDDGTEGLGLGVFTIAEAGISPTVTIIAFKEFSAYEVSGTFDAGTLSVQRIKSDMGCVAARTIQFISGFGLIRLTHRGFALYDGVNDTLISEEERPRIFGRDDITGLDWTNIRNCMAAQVANPPLYVCACPVAGGDGSLQRMFVFDLVRRAWTVLTFANKLATLELILNPQTLPQVLGGDFEDGHVRQMFAGDTSDDGTPIDWSLTTREEHGGTPMGASYFRRLLLNTFGMEADTAISCIFHDGVNQQTTTQTVRSLSPVTAGQGYGNEPWGTAPYGDPITASEAGNQTLVFDVLGGVIANSMWAEISGQGPGRIRGVEWHVRTKPLKWSPTSVLQR